MIDNETKKQIQTQLINYCEVEGSDNKASKKLGVSNSYVSNIRNNKWDMISDDMWRKISKLLGINLAEEWVHVDTLPFLAVNGLFEDAKKYANVYGVIVEPGSVKTHALDRFRRSLPNVGYVKCQRHHREKTFLKELMTSLGKPNSFNSSHGLLQQLGLEIDRKDAPLIIIDEFEKVSTEVLLLFIDIYNTIETKCGIVVLGTPNLQRRIETGVINDRMGFNEILSRLGGKFINIPAPSIKDASAVIRATLSGGTLNIPQYVGASYTAGTGLTLSGGAFAVNISQAISTLSNLTTNGLIKTSGGTGSLSIATSGTDYQAPITLTTTGTGGAATFSSGTLNIPQYAVTTYSNGNGISLSGSTFSVNPAYGNVFTTAQTINTAGVGGTLTIGWQAQNTTLSTSTTTVQSPPVSLFTGHAWNTTTASDNQIDAYTTLTPISGATPNFQFQWASRVSTSGTGAYSNLMYLTNGGNLVVSGSITGNSNLNIGSIYLSGGIYGASVISTNSASALILGYGQSASAAGTAVEVHVQSGVLNSSGVYALFAINQIINQTGTAGTSYLQILTTETATGSGAQLFEDYQVGGVQKWAVDHHGKMIVPTSGSATVAGSVTLSSGTVTINTTVVTSSSILLAIYKTASGTLGVLAQGTIVAGTSIVINSLTSAGAVNTSDNSTVNYWIFN